MRLLLFLILPLIISSCAQVVSPNGGPKDKKAPRVTHYQPDSAATNFSDNKIVLSFDEFIQLKNVSQQLIVSPPLKNQPEIKAKKKSVEIILNDTLKKNTTYTINFGNSISDINEGNVLENLNYVFSTGSKIDSLSITGFVYNAFTSSPEKEVLVMLYDKNYDSIPYKEKPLYVGKTNINGQYTINNVKEGSYKIFALKDVNNNYLFNSPDEMLGFSDTLIQVKRKTNVNLFLFKEHADKLKVLKKGISGYGQIEIVFNKPIEKYVITAIDYSPKKDWHIHQMNSTSDTIKTWITTAGDRDTLKLIVEANDITLDTFKVSTSQLFRKNIQGGRGEVIKFGYAVNISANTILPGKPLIFDFIRPLNSFEKKDIMLYENNKKIEAIFSNEKDRKTRYMISNTFFADSVYSLYIAPGAISDIYNFTNDTLKLKFSVAAEKNFGNLKLTLTAPSEKIYLLELLNEKGHVVKYDVVKQSTVLNYTALAPGKYSLRAITDENKDVHWTTGKYLKHSQPEKVIYFQTPITIRSNWDLEQAWKIE